MLWRIFSLPHGHHTDKTDGQIMDACPLSSPHRGQSGFPFPGPVPTVMPPPLRRHQRLHPFAAETTQRASPRATVSTQTGAVFRLATSPLVDTLHRGHGLALVLVEGGADDAAVRQVDLAVGLLLPAESVLHPVGVVTVGVVLAGVGATRLLAVRGRGGSLGTVFRG